MPEFLHHHETAIRVAAFGGVLLLMGAWEMFAPRRRPTSPRATRWLNNLGLVLFNSIVLRILFPVAAVGVAEFAHTNNLGVLRLAGVSGGWSVLLSLVVLDFFIWLQHVVVHAVPILWRLHRVHHADPDYDTTTGIRFHTVEIILSMLIKFAVILFLGPPALAVVVFEILLNASAMFNHGNVAIPRRIDSILRLLVVTPDMHRVHHSVYDDETNSNFGFNLPWWDRLFGTYKAEPRDGHRGMTIGIDGFTDPALVTRLWGLLRLPFVGSGGDYAINRRSWR